MRTVVTVTPGFGLSWSASPTATPAANTAATNRILQRDELRPFGSEVEFIPGYTSVAQLTVISSLNWLTSWSPRSVAVSLAARSGFAPPRSAKFVLPVPSAPD